MLLSFQIVSALIVGVFYYMLAMMMTVYDGVFSLIFQPIVGTILSSIAGALLLLIGFPIRNMTRIHLWWRKHWWIPFMIGSVAFMMMCFSWLPQFRVQVIHPDLEIMVDSFHPLLALTGWLLTIFAVLHFYPPLTKTNDEQADVDKRASSLSNP